MTIPYTFAGATTAIPLAQLDANFASPITLGNVAMTLSNTYTSIGNLTLTNVTVSSGNVAVTNLSYTGTLTGGTGIVNLGSGQFYIDGSGNVGIGTSSLTAKFTVAGPQYDNKNTANIFSYDTTAIAADIGGGLMMGGYYTGTTPTAWAAVSGLKNNATSGDYGGYLAFKTRANGSLLAEAMRIDSSGNLLVGLTSTTGAKTVSAYGNFRCRAGVGGAETNAFVINWTGSPQLWIDTTNVGTLATTSDYRVKRNIETQTVPALERVMALRPVTYQMADYGDLFKSSDDIKEGFIAHEVQEVIPSGAEGKKDEEDRIQSLRVDAILSVAVKAIQEQQALIENLTTRLTALENK